MSRNDSAVKITDEWLVARGFYVAHADGTLMSPMVEMGLNRLIRDPDGRWKIWNSGVIGTIRVAAPPRTRGNLSVLCRLLGVKLTKAPVIKKSA